MADNDIYNNEARYEYFKTHTEDYLTPPCGQRKFQIKNKANFQYIRKIIRRVEAKDLSYIRRLRLLRTYMMMCHYAEKDFSEFNRDDVDDLVIDTYANNRSDKSKSGFIIDLKHLWKIILPERDEKGRIDDTILPYPVRHLTSKIDRSRQKVRKDRITFEEYEKIIASFADDPRMQALLSIIFESLGRPQELMDRNLNDTEVYENYASITISQHGKEGVGILRVIDSYFYLSKWLNAHPLKHDPNAPLFVNLGQRNRHKRMTPNAANKLLKEHCKRLKIDKPVTLYSFKRNGVTYCRLRGDSDVDIQHRARWTSTRQLNTYDLSNQQDTFEQELMRRGFIDKKENQNPKELSKQCPFCKCKNGLGEQFCLTCQRPLDRQSLEKHEDKMAKLQKELEESKARDNMVLKLLQGMTNQGLMPELVKMIQKEGLEEELARIG